MEARATTNNVGLVVVGEYSNASFSKRAAYIIASRDLTARISFRNKDFSIYVQLQRSHNIDKLLQGYDCHKCVLHAGGRKIKEKVITILL